MDVPGVVSVTDMIGTSTVSDAVEDAVRQHARFLYRLAFAVLRDQLEAEDVVQDTFVAVCRQAKELSKVEDQRAWLARIAWRVIAKRRKRQREAALDDPARPIELPAQDVGTEQALLDREQRRLFQRMLHSLPAELYEIVGLSTIEEMTTSQIASILGIPESTVRGRLLRARQLLREKLERIMENTK